MLHFAIKLVIGILFVLVLLGLLAGAIDCVSTGEKGPSNLVYFM